MDDHNDDEIYTGQVKFFNPRKGFGFITYDVFRNPSEEREDIFVHATNLSPYYQNGDKNWLMDGEYVEFKLEDSEKGLKAVDVTGLNGGKLMMDIRSARSYRSRGRRQERTEKGAADEEKED